MTKEIPFAQIRRIMKNTPTPQDISKGAVEEMEEVIISEINKCCSKAKKIMGYKNVLTIQPEFLDFDVKDLHEADLAKAPIDRLIRATGIMRIGEGTINKFIKYFNKIIKDITREAEIFSLTEGKKTIMKRHVKYGTINVIEE